jgi:hypothetical protein
MLGRLSSTAIVVAQFIASAQAQEFPILDSDAHCESKAADLSGDAKSEAVLACRTLENAAKGRPEYAWQLSAAGVRPARAAVRSKS